MASIRSIVNQQQSVGSVVYRCICAVTVSSPTPFRGFILQARRLGQPSVVGQFVVAASSEYSDDDAIESPDATTPAAQLSGIRPVNCDAPQDTLVTWHRDVIGSYNDTFVWIAPVDDVGPVQFV